MRYMLQIYSSDTMISKDAPLMTWVKHRQEYLDACLILDGRGRFASCCANINCLAASPMHRCRDCFGQRLYCQTCILGLHQSLPLHRIQVSFCRDLQIRLKNDVESRNGLKHTFSRYPLGT